VPCAAHGTDARGRELVVVFAAEADPDVVPWAADARLRCATPDARLVLAMASRNAMSAIRASAEALRVPAEFVDPSARRG
jgi:hypothetical protein